MIDKILAISGKPGLYRLVSRGNNMLICESLVDGHRIPALQRDKVLSLSDIAMYSTADEVPLNTIFGMAKTLTGGKIAPVTLKSSAEEQRAWFEQVFPEYDADRVHAGDIRKFIQWYNILIETGNDDFSEPVEETEEAETAPVSEPEAEPVVAEEAPKKKPAARKTAKKSEK